MKLLRGGEKGSGKTAAAWDHTRTVSFNKAREEKGSQNAKWKVIS